jgi:hypothetical protein
MTIGVTDNYSSARDHEIKFSWFIVNNKVEKSRQKLWQDHHKLLKFSFWKTLRSNSQTGEVVELPCLVTDQYFHYEG